MLQIRKSEDRGFANHGWLIAKHSFSFSSYYDDRFLGFRDLRVINEDQVLGGGGFATHGHEDMEIITYILEGALEHKDSMGNGSVIRPGDVQYMSAGTGVKHSEFNHSKTEKVHLFQTWILPAHEGEKPQYDQKNFSREARTNQLCLLASPDGAKGSIAIRQDVKLYGSLLSAGKTIQFDFQADRYGWLQLAKGSIEVNAQIISAGDGIYWGKEKQINITASSDAEFILFDLN